MNLILNHWRHNVFLFLQSWNMCTCRVFRKHYGPVVWTRTSVCSCLCAQINRYCYYYYYYNLTSVQRRQRRGWKVINRLFAQRWVDENCNRLRIPLFQSQMFTFKVLLDNKKIYCKCLEIKSYNATPDSALWIISVAYLFKSVLSVVSGFIPVFHFLFHLTFTFTLYFHKWFSWISNFKLKP